MAKFTGHTITPDSALGGVKIERSVRFNKTDAAFSEKFLVEEIKKFGHGVHGLKEQVYTISEEQVTSSVVIMYQVTTVLLDFIYNQINFTHILIRQEPTLMVQ